MNIIENAAHRCNNRQVESDVRQLIFCTQRERESYYFFYYSDPRVINYVMVLIGVFRLWTILQYNIVLEDKSKTSHGQNYIGII